MHGTAADSKAGDRLCRPADGDNLQMGGTPNESSASPRPPQRREIEIVLEPLHFAEGNAEKTGVLPLIAYGIRI